VILEQAAALRDAVPIILHHHERFAGHGYPYGLRANEIPLGARIVAIADAYDAMVHDRPYKRAIPHDQAIEELRRHAGTQFDPELVELFCDLYADRAPEPDLAVTALNAAAPPPRAGSGTPLIVPEVRTATDRRRRRTDLRPADGQSAVATGPSAEPGSEPASQTMAADGALGVPPAGGIPVTPDSPTPISRRRRSVLG
jgi:hypothetical protein